MSDHCGHLYIDGEWIPPESRELVDVTNPTDGSVVGRTVRARAADLDRAVEAANRAFATFSRTSVGERLELLESLKNEFDTRLDELGSLISAEMGSPIAVSKQLQAPLGSWHLGAAIQTLKDFEFESERAGALVVSEPIGVVGMITPWNWPVHQIMSKLAFAVAAGCTSILKPSELAPLNATIIAEVFEAAGAPAGVFNLVPGRGSVIGEAMASHPDIDVISLTGSTTAGARVAAAAAPTVKRVTQELGGKSANILCDDVDVAQAVRDSISAAFSNNGQSCDAPTRLLVPESRRDEVAAACREAASALVVGPSDDPATEVGPVVSREQFDSIQEYISSAIDEGADVVVGGLGAADGSRTGLIVKPTVLMDVTPTMTVFQEEIFGPVLCVSTYTDLDDAVDLANDSPYGLAAYVSTDDPRRARDLSLRLRAGQVRINFMRANNVPFGGYKQSGNGREFGPEGLAEFLEIKAISGLRQ